MCNGGNERKRKAIHVYQRSVDINTNKQKNIPPQLNARRSREDRLAKSSIDESLTRFTFSNRSGSVHAPVSLIWSYSSLAVTLSKFGVSVVPFHATHSVYRYRSVLIVYPMNVNSVFSTVRQLLSSPFGNPRAPQIGMPTCTQRGYCDVATSLTDSTGPSSIRGRREMPSIGRVSFSGSGSPTKSRTVGYTSTNSTSALVRGREFEIHGARIMRGTRVPSSQLLRFSHMAYSPRCHP